MRRRRWVIGAALGVPLVVLLGLALSYLVLVVDDHPLRSPTVGDSIKAALGVPPYDARVVHYQDGQTFTVEQWVHNSGRYAVTVTGVESTSDWLGMVKMNGARAAVFKRGAPCCVIDEPATWAIPAFTPFRLEPGKEMALVMHYVLGNCEKTIPGATNSFDSVRVDYDEVGDHKTVELQFDRLIVVQYDRDYQCPRPPSVSPMQTP